MYGGSRIIPPYIKNSPYELKKTKVINKEPLNVRNKEPLNVQNERQNKKYDKASNNTKKNNNTIESNQYMSNKSREIKQYNPIGSSREPLVEFKINSLANTNPVNSFPMDPYSYGATVPPANVPMNNMIPHEYPYNSYLFHGGVPYQPNKPPINNIINVNAPNPTGDHTQFANIIEDHIPKELSKNSSLTLEERLNISDILHDQFVTVREGEDISIGNDMRTTFNRKNLLSYIKNISLQPYHNSKLSNNIYKHAPTDKLIMYNSCYPQVQNKFTNKTECHRFSIGLNLRIYDMSIGEYNVNNMQNFSESEFNLWREMNFYKLVRSEILEKKVCPNFPLMYSYFIASGDVLDYVKLGSVAKSFLIRKNKAKQKLEEKYLKKYNENMIERENKNLYELNKVSNPTLLVKERKMEGGETKGEEKKEDIKSKNEIGKVYNPTKLETSKFEGKKMVDLDGSINNPHKYYGKEIKEIDEYEDYKRRLFKLKQITDSIGKNLLVLTETYNYNIFKWATPEYKNEYLSSRKVMKENRDAWYNKKIWFSIFFQLTIALQVMFYKKFTFINMKLEDNVYIKDLRNQDRTIGFWKYVFDGIEYFIPNYGYLLMIDSNFKEIKSDDKTFLSKKQSEDEEDEIYKLYGMIDSNFDSSEDSENMKTLNRLQYDNLKTLFNPDNFRKTSGARKLNNEVIKFLEKIYKKILIKKEKNGDLSEIILNDMNMFLHNRIGTLISKDEESFVNHDTDITSFSPIKGNLYPYHIGLNKYVWILYIGERKDIEGNDQKLILKRENDNLITEPYTPGKIKDYIGGLQAEQQFKADDTTFSNSNLLETYYVN